MAINPQKLLPPGRTGGSLTKVSKKVISTDSFSNFGSSKISKDIGVIKIKVIQIENILKGTIAAEKKALDEKKRLESGKRREKQEEKLETKKQPEKGEIKTPKVPRMGFLDWIKNFIGNVLLGYFAVRMLDFLPKIKPIIGFLGSAADFVIDVGGKLLNGLVTFIDWGYKAIDFTKGMMKSIGGENFAKVFDGFTGAVGTLVETAIIAATVLATQGDGGVLDIGMDMLKDRLLGQGAQRAAQAGAQVAGQVGRTAGLGVGTAVAIVAGAGLAASALGEGAFQVKKISQKFEKNIKEYSEAGKKDKNPITRALKMSVWSMFGPFLRLGNWLLNGIGVTLDIVGAPFRYAIELVRYGIMLVSGDTKGIEQQRKNLAKFDARIRDGIREHFAGFLGPIFGFMGKKDWKKGIETKGSFGNIYGNKGAQKEMMGKMSGGGITRGGKAQTGARRTIGGKKKYKRQIPRKPGEVEIKPGADVGGEDKIFGIFPNPLKAAQKVVDAVNPFNVVKSAGENLGKTDYFGPILAITSKITLGQKPSQKDYENVGLGINMLIAKGIQEKQLKGGIVAAFAEGGLVDPDVLSAAETGGDISNWVAKTFQGEIESNAQKTLRLIKENTRKKKEDSDASTSPRDSGESGSIETAGGAVAASELYKEIGANLEQWDIYRNSIALIESKGKYGIPGGSGMHYDGRYQMGRDAKIDGSRVAGVPNPGHSDDPNAHVRVSFRNNPQLQETIFTGFTIANHRYLMRNPKYKSASVERKLEILGYAHNQGMGGAENWLNTGKVGADGFGTKGTKYTDLIAKNFRAKKSGGQMELAQGAIPVPKEPTGVPLSQGKVSGIVNDRDWNTGIKLTTLKTKSGKSYQVASVLSNQFGEFISDLEATGYKIDVIGGYRKAGTGGGTGPSDPDYDKERYSHPYGASVDINPSRNPYGKTLITDMPSNIREIAAKHGLGWGGNWRSVKDAMHFSAMQREGGNRDWGLFRKDGPAFAKSSAFHGKSFGIVPKGGMKLTLHEGEMFRVVDKDSVKLLGYDLTKDIISIENKAQLVAKAPSIIERLKSISGYADYEQPYAEPQIIEVPVEVPVPMGDYQSSGGGVALIPFGGGDDPFETLYKGG